MKYIYLFYLLFLTFILSSCNKIAENITWTGLIALSIVLMALFSFMFYLIIKRRNQGDKSLAQFSASVHAMLSKLDNAEQKVESLKILINRINVDEKYKKDTTWRDKVLANTYLHLATQYNALEDTKNTLDTCSKILRLTPDDAMTLYNRGSLYSNMGEYNKALSDFNRSINLVDDYASSYNNRGFVQSKLGRDDYAFSDFKKALELEKSPAIYLNIGNAYKNIRDTNAAKENYLKALELISAEDNLLKDEIEKAIKKLL